MDEEDTEDRPEHEESSHERMERYEELARREREYGAKKREMLEDVGSELTTAVETAIEQTGANVAVESTGKDGVTQTLRPRLDRAALIAEICDQLPDGFAIKSLNDDGSLTVEWNRRTDRSAQQRAGIIIKAIVSEELTTDSDNLIESVPSRQAVIERASEFDVPEDLATQRLDRLAALDVLEIEDGLVYPGGNFSRL